MHQHDFPALHRVRLPDHRQRCQALKQSSGGGAWRDAVGDRVDVLCRGGRVLAVAGGVGAECYDTLADLEAVGWAGGSKGCDYTFGFLAEDAGVAVRMLASALPFGAG
jgi:hypothetical protein